MNIRAKDFRVPPNEKITLKKWPTTMKPIGKSKKLYQKLLKKDVEVLSVLQKLYYASSRYALLLFFREWTPEARTARSGI